MQNNLSQKSLLDRLRRDVILRGELISTGASVVAVLLMTTVIYLFLLNKLETRVEDSLTTRHKVALSNVIALTDADRIIVRKFRQSLPVRDEGVFAWIDSDGETFSSNVIGLDCRTGFYDRWLNLSQQTAGEPLALVSADKVDTSRHERFRFLAQKRHENCLVFGSSMFGVDALRKNMIELYLWLIPLCLLPSLLISLKHSTTLRRRLFRLGNVMHTLSRGDLDARVPVEGDDDIDRLASYANHSFDRLQESVNTLQQLTSVMAHDLRAPLNRVVMPLDEAMRANESGNTDVESLELVKGELADVRAVFDALLRISQIESGRRRSNFTNVDLFEVAKRLYGIYQPVVEDSGRTLEFESTGEGAGVVRGDVELITQALVNLIENATCYTPAGSVIRICLLSDATHATLIVRDNGPGLPEAERPRVLRRLYRFEGSTDEKGESGHGLGLSLVKAVVDLHDGGITLEDARPGLLVRLKFNAIPIESTWVVGPGGDLDDYQGAKNRNCKK